MLASSSGSVKVSPVSSHLTDFRTKPLFLCETACLLWANQWVCNWTRASCFWLCVTSSVILWFQSEATLVQATFYMNHVRPPTPTKCFWRFFSVQCWVQKDHIMFNTLTLWNTIKCQFVFCFFLILIFVLIMQKSGRHLSCYILFKDRVGLFWPCCEFKGQISVVSCVAAPALQSGKTCTKRSAVSWSRCNRDLNCQTWAVLTRNVSHHHLLQ